MKVNGRVMDSLAPHFLSLALATILVAGAAGPAEAAQVALPGERAFPENLTSTRDGTLYVGSMAEGGIWRAAAGAAVAEPWIAPGADGTRSTFGVLADEGRGLLWVCSTDVSGWGIPGPGNATGSTLKAFHLATGQLKASAALPGEAAACNDIAIAADGAVYVSDVDRLARSQAQARMEWLRRVGGRRALHAAPERRAAWTDSRSATTVPSISPPSARASCSRWR